MPTDSTGYRNEVYEERNRKNRMNPVIESDLRRDGGEVRYSMHNGLRQPNHRNKGWEDQIIKDTGRNGSKNKESEKLGEAVGFKSLIIYVPAFYKYSLKTMAFIIIIFKVLWTNILLKSLFYEFVYGDNS